MNQVNDDFLIDVRHLSRQAGTAKQGGRLVAATAGFGLPLIGVNEGEPIQLSWTLEAVGEGVLVTGQASYQLKGQCARCLTDIAYTDEANFQELFLYPGHGDGDADLSRIEQEMIDLEPVVHDAIVLDLPLSPLCEDNCAGLCADCGANLNLVPDHHHGAAGDARWAGLGQWLDELTDGSTQAEAEGE